MDDQPTLVETDWLQDNLKNDGISIVDATWYLPNVDATGIRDYENGHIPGAVFWDLDRIADAGTALPHMLPNAIVFEGHMRDLGIANSNHVVVYDNVRMMTAPRVWWMLRAFGHENVSVLNGGLLKWKAEKRTTTSKVPEPKSVEFKAVLNPEMVRSLGRVLGTLESMEEQVLDARSAGRFWGKDAEPRPDCRSGHIPGSLNLPFNELIDPTTGLFHPVEQLRRRFQQAGIDADRPVITTCGSGVTACVLSLALSLIGREDVSIYDGSWTEWGGRMDTPVET
ncbi:MAG: 3-mercaptopyruvate sulfurtransferase [Pseudomonadota bacterium]|nr:3-mercaptopyruvate sulfurtransferase [Pseudomonadota bacterium]